MLMMIPPPKIIKCSFYRVVHSTESENCQESLVIVLQMCVKYKLSDTRGTLIIKKSPVPGLSSCHGNCQTAAVATSKSWRRHHGNSNYQIGRAHV